MSNVKIEDLEQNDVTVEAADVKGGGYKLTDLIVSSVNPRDAASGLATGKR